MQLLPQGILEGMETEFHFHFLPFHSLPSNRGKKSVVDVWTHNKQAVFSVHQEEWQHVLTNERHENTQAALTKSKARAPPFVMRLLLLGSRDSLCIFSCV